MTTRRRSEALREQRALRDELRSWRESLIRAAQKARVKAAKKRAEKKPDGSRGVDRVPKHLRGLAVTPEVLVEHVGPTYVQRRRHSLRTGRRLQPSINAPYVNPARDAKRHARLRREVSS